MFEGVGVVTGEPMDPGGQSGLVADRRVNAIRIEKYA
jgi:hypothetical protein